MGTRDPRIDAYIARSADFAQPILTHLREVVHTACPVVDHGRSKEAMGQFGRITSLDKLPSRKVLTGYIKKAMALNEKGIKSPTRMKRAPRLETAIEWMAEGKSRNWEYLSS